MKSEQVVKERLKSAKQEIDVFDILLSGCDKCEREGLVRERAKVEGEVKTLEWILESSVDNDKE